MTSKTKSKNEIQKTKHKNKIQKRNQQGASWSILEQRNQKYVLDKHFKKFRISNVYLQVRCALRALDNSLGSYKEKRALQADNPKKLSFSIDIRKIFSYHTFFETTKCHFLVVQVIFVKRSDGQLAGRDKVILNISHASRVLDNRIRSSLQIFDLNKCQIFSLHYYSFNFMKYIFKYIFENLILLLTQASTRDERSLT